MKRLSFSDLKGIITRYVLLLVLGLNGLIVFYTIFTSPTIYFSKLMSSLFYETLLLPGNVLLIEGQYIKIVSACVAGSAYYLLTILNLTTPMSFRQRIKSLVFVLSAFFIFNSIRIFIFSHLSIIGYEYFDTAHLASWYIGSIALVIGIWFSNQYLFKIKEVPVLSDIKKIMSLYSK